MDDTKLELKFKTINTVLAYLSKRPWDEANSLINAVHEEILPQLEAKKEIQKPDEAVGGTD